MKATPEQWAALERWALEKDNACSCILELRARIEALEAATRPASKVYEINEPLQLTPEQAQHVRDLLAPNSKPIPNPSQIRSSLVKRVHTCIVGEPECGHMQARAAIREVAAWLREEGYPSSPGRLEREVEQ